MLLNSHVKSIFHFLNLVVDIGWLVSLIKVKKKKKEMKLKPPCGSSKLKNKNKNH